jgi:ribonuclease-3
MQDITAPQIDEADKIVKMLSNVNKNAKQDLYVLMDAEKVPAPVYVVTKIGSTNSDFEVTCLIQGKEMGRGIGKNKSDAGARAAMQVLERLEASSRKGVATEKAGEPEDGECQE